LKNWLREQGPLDAWVSTVLSRERVGVRGFFRPEAVARLLDEHRRGRHNHSHRLWAMVMLDEWVDAHVAPIHGSARAGAA
jgi:asparagine synthase (glutamine-hydrolysing)